jgi:hypothetical protein
MSQFENGCVTTRKGAHDAIATMQKELKENPSADWMREWIICLSYFCSCTACRRRLKETDADTQMLDKIFGIE